MSIDLAFTAVKVLGAIGFGMSIAGFFGWVERKQSAVLQDRVGANRASVFGFKFIGLFHPIADALKMLSKEDFVPPGADRVLYAAAPMITLGMGLLCLAALPFGGVVEAFGRAWSLQPIEGPAGLVLVLGLLSLGVHGIMMAGFSGGSNYGLLGALRGAAQMIAFEVGMVVTLAGVLFIYGSLDLQQAVLWQREHVWGVFVQPLSFILFLTAGAATTKRTPFDVPEGESEIVGYHVEYGGMKFGMFLTSDFIESVVVSGLVTALFLGGWDIPFYEPRGLLGAALMLASFSIKVLFIMHFLLQVRWTLPRFRFDQLLHLGWKNILPLSLVNFLVTVWAVYLWR